MKCSFCGNEIVNRDRWAYVPSDDYDNKIYFCGYDCISNFLDTKNKEEIRRRNSGFRKRFSS